jgi:hypothetical protein
MEDIIGSAQVIGIVKLKTHDEVIDAIIDGFIQGTHWDQRKVVHRATQSEEHPCGTQFCMLGAILTCFNLPAYDTPVLDLTKLLLEESIIKEWVNVFQCMSEDAAVNHLSFLLPEQKDKLLSRLTPKSIRLL